jgi:hypothetical protein
MHFDQFFFGHEEGRLETAVGFVGALQSTGVGAVPMSSRARTALVPIQASPSALAWRAASSLELNKGSRRSTRSCVMLPRPERMDTDAA